MSTGGELCCADCHRICNAYTQAPALTRQSLLIITMGLRGLFTLMFSALSTATQLCPTSATQPSATASMAPSANCRGARRLPGQEGVHEAAGGGGPPPPPRREHGRQQAPAGAVARVQEGDRGRPALVGLAVLARRQHIQLERALQQPAPRRPRARDSRPRPANRERQMRRSS